jgi:hypothetical protein
MTRAIKKKQEVMTRLHLLPQTTKKNPILPIHVSISIAKIAGAE